jgi:hypothetical protein
LFVVGYANASNPSGSAAAQKGQLASLVFTCLSQEGHGLIVGPIVSSLLVFSTYLRR